MKNLMKAANDYVKDMSVCDVALLKVCVCAAGVLIGLSIPARRKKAAAAGAAVVLLAACMPLLIKLNRVIRTS